MSKFKTLQHWIDLMTNLSHPVIEKIDAPAELKKTLKNHPRHLTAPLLAYCLDRKDIKTPQAILDKPKGLEDVLLWWALLDDSITIDNLFDPNADGPLFDSQIGRTYQTIEVWTETELAGLHALWHHTQRCKEPDQSAQQKKRITRTVNWHIEHTQPDNATGHPWSVHIFLLHNTPQSLHYVETLLSNCLVNKTEPDPLSAWILQDAARALLQ